MGEDINRLIVLSIRTALEETGKSAFNASQDACPVDGGGLKNSGTMKNNFNEFIIRYAADYAESVERGLAGGRVWVGGHSRTGGTYVKGHYKNQTHREGVHFIENSLRKFFKERTVNNRTPFQASILEELMRNIPTANITDETLI